MMTVHEVSKLSGVSIRVLHHYDNIGLLPATDVTEAGYRLYDDAAERSMVDFYGTNIDRKRGFYIIMVDLNESSIKQGKYL